MGNSKIPANMMMSPAPSSVFYSELAADFVEQQVGTYRWIQNLTAMTQAKQLRPKIETWLKIMHIRAKPELVLQAISQLLARKTGQWKR